MRGEGEEAEGEVEFEGKGMEGQEEGIGVCLLCCVVCKNHFLFVYQLSNNKALNLSPSVIGLFEQQLTFVCVCVCVYVLD